jgi:hypothetical protein
MFHEAVAAVLGNAVPLVKHPTAPAVAESLNPVVFAVKADKISFAVEAAVARTARLTFAGARDLYAGNAWSLGEFLAGSKTMPPLKDIAKHMKSLDAAGAAELSAKGDHVHKAVCRKGSWTSKGFKGGFWLG